MQYRIELVMIVGVEKKVYSFRLDEDIAESLRQFAQSENRTLSNMVETILKEYVARRAGKSAPAADSGTTQN